MTGFHRLVRRLRRGEALLWRRVTRDGVESQCGRVRIETKRDSQTALVAYDVFVDGKRIAWHVLGLSEAKQRACEFIAKGKT